MDKITEIVLRHIENLERIEAELTEDLEDMVRINRDLDLDIMLLVEALEQIANHAGNPAEIASVALDAMTCKGRPSCIAE